MTRRFAITFDYLCPFARNANEHVLAGLQAGADWDVTFQPYSLAQGHLDDDQPAVWDLPDPATASGVLALQVGLAVRDHVPERFIEVHRGLFSARHDQGADLKDRDLMRQVLSDAGTDPDQVLDLVADGRPLKVLHAEHEAGVRDHEVWGVPTFIAGGRAVFVRLLDRPDGDGAAAIRAIDQVVDLVEGALALHEFKQTDLPM